MRSAKSRALPPGAIGLKFIRPPAPDVDRILSHTWAAALAALEPTRPRRCRPPPMPTPKTGRRLASGHSDPMIGFAALRNGSQPLTEP